MLTAKMLVKRLFGVSFSDFLELSEIDGNEMPEPILEPKLTKSVDFG